MDFDAAYHRLSDPDKLRNPGPAHQVSNEFEDSLLGIERMPEEHFRFISRVFSDAILLARPGLEYLVMALYSDKEKFSDAQLNSLFDGIERHYDLVQDEALAYAFFDFVSRAMEPVRALRLLKKTLAKTKNRAALSGILLGLDILRRSDNAADKEIAALIADAENKFR